MTRDFPRLHLRLILAPDTLLGPGKADLLQAIVETGSIAAAGRRMGMGYKRAWHLIDTMNAYFGEPLVVAVVGGKAGGGARLTPMGEHVLSLYRRIEVQTREAVAIELHELLRLAKRKRD